MVLSILASNGGPTDPLRSRTVQCHPRSLTLVPIESA